MAHPKEFMKWAAVTVFLYVGFFVSSGGDALEHRFFVQITYEQNMRAAEHMASRQSA